MRAVLASAALALASSVLAATPQRVVTLSPHLAELVCAAGACDKLVGVVAYSDYPPEVTRLPKVGDAFNADLERIASLRPDLVLSWEGGSSAQTVARLRSIGLRVENLRVRKLDEIAGAITRLGEMLGSSSQAAAAARSVRDRLGVLRDRYRGVKPIRVFYEVQVQPLYTVNADSPISEAIALCGGVNVFADIGALAGMVSLEAVFAANPEAIIEAGYDEAAGLAFWRAHPQLPAVAAGRIYPVNADLLARATPRMLDGIQQLCEGLQRARVQQ